jgi:hypothetical protein
MFSASLNVGTTTVNSGARHMTFGAESVSARVSAASPMCGDALLLSMCGLLELTTLGRDEKYFNLSSPFF